MMRFDVISYGNSSDSWCRFHLEKYFQFGPKFKLDHKITFSQHFNNWIGSSNLPLLDQVNNAKRYFLNGPNAANFECLKVVNSRTSVFWEVRSWKQIENTLQD